MLCIFLQTIPVQVIPKYYIVICPLLGYLLYVPSIFLQTIVPVHVIPKYYIVICPLLGYLLYVSLARHATSLHSSHVVTLV